MANLCSNTIELKGKAVELKRFDGQFKASHTSFRGGTLYTKKEHFEIDEKWIDYNIIKEDEDGSMRVCVIDEMSEQEGYSFSNFVPMTKEDWLNDWYKWCVKNWGTKWDIGDDIFVNGLEEIEEAIKNNDPDKELTLTYSITTAWSPCCPVVAEMARQYPGLKIVHAYQEDGLLIAGIQKFENGELISHEQADPDEFREFLLEGFEEEFFRCKDCNGLLYEWELEDDACPDCGSKNIEDCEQINKGLNEEVEGN